MFEKRSSFNSVIFRQHLHLADGNGIKFRQSFRLRYSFADEYCIQVFQIGQAHKLRDIGIVPNVTLTIYKVIAQRGAVGAKLLTFYPLLIAPAYIAGDGLAFCLCKGCVQGGHQL